MMLDQILSLFGTDQKRIYFSRPVVADVDYLGVCERETIYGAEKISPTDVELLCRSGRRASISEVLA